MRSRAAVGNHPVHPALVAIPIGAFVLAFVSDVAWLRTERPFWAEMAAVCLAVGLLGALFAAVPGLIDYVALPVSSKLRRTATRHMILNFTVVGLNGISLYLRCRPASGPFEPDSIAIGLSTLAIVLLGASGWLGGKMVFEMRAGVVEPGESSVVRP